MRRDSSMVVGWALAVVCCALVLLPHEATAEVEQLRDSPSERAASYYNKVPGFSLTNGATEHDGKTSREECRGVCSADPECKSYSWRESDKTCVTSKNKVEYDSQYTLYVKAKLSGTQGKFRSFPGLVYRTTNYLECNSDDCDKDKKCACDKQKGECDSAKQCECQCSILASCESFSYRKVTAEKASQCLLSGKSISYSEGFNYYEKKGVIATTKTGTDASDAVDSSEAPKPSEAQSAALQALLQHVKAKAEAARASIKKAEGEEANAAAEVKKVKENAAAEEQKDLAETKEKEKEAANEIQKEQTREQGNFIKKNVAQAASEREQKNLEFAAAALKEKKEEEASAAKRAEARAAKNAAEKEKLDAKEQAARKRGIAEDTKNAAEQATNEAKQKAIQKEQLDAKKERAEAAMENQQAEDEEKRSKEVEEKKVEQAKQKAAQEAANAREQEVEVQKQLDEKLTKVEAEASAKEAKDVKENESKESKQKALNLVRYTEEKKSEEKKQEVLREIASKERIKSEALANKAQEKVAEAQKEAVKAQAQAEKEKAMGKISEEGNKAEADNKIKEAQIAEQAKMAQIEQDRREQEQKVEFEKQKKLETTQGAARRVEKAAQEDAKALAEKKKQEAKEAVAAAKDAAAQKEKLDKEQLEATKKATEEKAEKEKKKSEETQARQKKALEDEKARDEQASREAKAAADAEIAQKEAEARKELDEKKKVQENLMAQKLAKAKKDNEKAALISVVTLPAVDTTFVDSGTPVGTMDMAELDAAVIKTKQELENAKKAAEIATNYANSWMKKAKQAEMVAAVTSAVASENSKAMNNAAHQNMTSAKLASQRAAVELQAAEAAQKRNVTEVQKAEKKQQAALTKQLKAQASLRPSNTPCGVKSCSGGDAPSKGLLKLLSTPKREKSTFLKFDAGDLAGSDTVTGAVLRVYKASGGEGPLLVKTVACTWNKQTLTYTNSSMFKGKAVSQGATLPELSQTWVDVVLNARDINRVKNSEADSKICLKLSGGSSETEDLLASEQYSDATKQPQLKLNIQKRAATQEAPKMAESAQTTQLRREFEKQKRSELQSQFTQELLNSNKAEHQLKEAQFQEACNKKINEETTGSAKSAIEAEAKAASDAAVDENIQKHKKELQQKADAEMQSKIAEAGLPVGSEAAAKLEADMKAQSTLSINQQLSTFADQARSDAQDALKKQVATVLTTKKSKIEAECNAARIEREKSSLGLSASQRLKVLGMIEKALPTEMAKFKVDGEGNVNKQSLLDSAKELGDHHMSYVEELLDE